MYSIFKRDFRYDYVVPEERELIYADWIADMFDEYRISPPQELTENVLILEKEKGNILSYEEAEKKVRVDDICDYIAKEFNIKRFFYETGSERSMGRLKEILSMNLCELQTDEILERIEGLKTDEDKWIGREIVWELAYRPVAENKVSQNVLVMNPDINGEHEEESKIR